MSFKYYNPNPSGKRVGDCVIRGIAKFTNQEWDDVYVGICLKGFLLKDMPSSNNVWESYLFEMGFHRKMLPNTCPICYTIRQFCADNKVGRYLLATGSHVVAVENGDYYDAWDSGYEVPIYFWEDERR